MMGHKTANNQQVMLVWGLLRKHYILISLELFQISIECTYHKKIVPLSFNNNVLLYYSIIKFVMGITGSDAIC